MRRAPFLVCGLVGWGASCLPSAERFCGDGLVCPAEQVCAPLGGSCVEPARVDACAAVADGAPCDLGALGAGVCRARLCAVVRCGDGILDPTGADGQEGTLDDEVCDDGNLAFDDGCAPDCRSDERCGNGVIDFLQGEQCDDGGTVAGDGCQPTCRLPACGDGVVDESLAEGCDDGPGNSVDPNAACRPISCRPAFCGDNVIDGAPGGRAAEACDYGFQNANVADADCRLDCTPQRCGDSIVDSGEGCDLGVFNSDEADQACRSSCTARRCGDGIVDPAFAETCDDGDGPDPASGDGCYASCTTVCGDGARAGREVCDDGNQIPGDGCASECNSLEFCGNGIVDTITGETCDDGDDGEPGVDGCYADCQPVCGDNVVDGLEECDDGNLESGDGCDGNCTVTRCGNGALAPILGEECDDGNEDDDDVCGNDCQLNWECGDGVPEGPETCDDGNFIDGDGCSETCQDECGSGTLSEGEECDDGDRDPGDGCSPDCTWECGDGAVGGDEECDDGDRDPGDGCSVNCQLEP